MNLARVSHRERGFSLIEVLAALSVFALVTVGIVPLLMSSMRGANLSRSMTVGKNVAQRAMERIRGLPYFLAYSAYNRRVDVLDLYFPNLTGGIEGQSYADGVFTTVCDSSDHVNPACPRVLPSGHALTFTAAFVQPDPNDPGSYVIKTPPSGYRWDSEDGSDLPASQLLEVVVRGDWSLYGRDRQFEIKTLVGDRKFAELNVRGYARIDHAVEMRTRFTDDDGELTELIVTGGSSESKIESKLQSLADQSVTAGQLRLLEVTEDENEVGTDLAVVTGARSVHHAPPDASPSGVTKSGEGLTHPDLGAEIAGLGQNSATDLSLGVAEELPFATGSWGYTGDAGEPSLWGDSQADRTPPLFSADPGDRMLWIPAGGLSGNTEATTGATGGAERGVDTSAAASLSGLELLPTDFIAGPGGERAVVILDSFEAEISCSSTADPASAAAAATWTGTLRYWRDSLPGDGFAEGAYEEVQLGSGLASDPLFALQNAALQDGDNPLVYEDVAPEEDIYLFDDPSRERSGYLATWDTTVSPSSSVDELGEVTAAGLAGAIRITTAPTDPDLLESGISVSVGKLSCEAVDQR